MRHCKASCAQPQLDKDACTLLQVMKHLAQAVAARCTVWQFDLWRRWRVAVFLFVLVTIIFVFPIFLVTFLLLYGALWL